MWFDEMPETQRDEPGANCSNLVRKAPLRNAYRYLILGVRGGDGGVGGVDIGQGKHVVDAESAANSSVPAAMRTISEADPGFEVVGGRIALPELTHRDNAARDGGRTYDRWAWAGAGRGGQVRDQTQAISLVRRSG